MDELTCKFSCDNMDEMIKEMEEVIGKIKPGVDIDKFYRFVDENYPIISDVPIGDTQRKIWYCNVSGVFIPELNNEKIHEEQDLGPLSLAAHDLFNNKGYRHYNIYPCGHCVLDVYFLAVIFDKMQFPWHPEWTEKNAIETIERTTKMCPMIDTPTRSNYYHVSVKLLNEQDFLNPLIIPERYLKYITHIFKEGEVVSTNGLLDTDLFILYNSEFKRVRIGEYYPIWPLKFVKIRGYRYYLNVNNGGFDSLPFDNDVVFLGSVNKFYPAERVKSEPGDGDNNIIYDELYMDDLQTIRNNNEYKLEIPERFNFSLFTEAPYPFPNCETANSYIKTGARFYSVLNKKETLVFFERTLIMTNPDGENMIILTD